MCVRLACALPPLRRGASKGAPLPALRGCGRASNVSAKGRRPLCALRPSRVVFVLVRGVYAGLGSEGGAPLFEKGRRVKLKVLANRVDWLTVRYRVRLSKLFVAALEEASKRAGKFGRTAFEYKVSAPTGTELVDLTVARRRRVGPLRLRWASEWDRAQKVEKIWGELGWSEKQNCWLITNEPYYRLAIRRNAAGGGSAQTCSGCAGQRFSEDGEVCGTCDGCGLEEEPGWTVEITWYAEKLAEFGLELALAETDALAANCGKVFESRTGRIDLCADVEGWTIQAEDLERIVKRPRAKCGREDDGVPTAGDLEKLGSKVRSAKQRAEDGARLYADGPRHRRRFTGFSVGRAGCIMSRVYDKRVELELDTLGQKRALEEERWRAAGWDGVAPVTRVEFQLRGVVLKELGIQNPGEAVEPEYEFRSYVDRRGKARVRRVHKGYRPIVVTEKDGREVKATIVHRLDAIWATCLEWVRLVEPEVSRNGNPLPASRLKDDVRWTLIKGVSFYDARFAKPIRRVRDRDRASPAQILGCMLSRAARAGMLGHFDEDRTRYPEDEKRQEDMLRRVVKTLFDHMREDVVTWLLERGEGPAGALEWFAVRANAARMRRFAGVSSVEEESRGPPEISSASAA